MNSAQQFILFLCFIGLGICLMLLIAHCRNREKVVPVKKKTKKVVPNGVFELKI